MSEGFPILWLRVGEGAPTEPGVYLRAADVAAWLRSEGQDALADLLDEENAWLSTETHVVMEAP